MLSATLQNKIRKLITPVPTRISKRFRLLDNSAEQELRHSLTTNYFAREIWGKAVSAAEYLASEDGREDFSQHLYQRLDNFRATVIPWLDSVIGLEGKRILEIGCGTGTSTVALAEQNARVTAIDIDDPSLQTARDRCRIYHLDVEILKGNGAEVRQVVGNATFDVIIYMAVVEHMTIEERLASLKSCWSHLNKNGYLSIIETPNRLWLYDAHTAWLPFYFWLPDELAYLYSEKSPRKPFNTTFQDKQYKDIEEFRRHGRGVSYHELELALGDCDGSSWKPLIGLRDFLRRRNPLWQIVHLLQTPLGFQRSLKKAAPHIPGVFFEQSLDMVIQRL